MRALFFDNGLRYISEYPEPVPVEGEALVKIKLSGICNTDIEITKGYMNFKGVPGHEFVGFVEEVNSNDKRLIGKRVVGDINCSCYEPECEYCNKNLGRHCPDRITLGIDRKDGCFAEYLTLPIENLVEVPDCVSDENAVFAEPLAAAFEILEQVEVKSRSKVLIVGDGKLGILINHAISTTDAEIYHVGKHPEKLKHLSSEHCKILHKDEQDNTKYDIVIEATGSLEGFQYSVDHIKPRGILILKSTLAESQNINLSPLVVNEITVVGSRCGIFSRAIDYLKTGVDLTPLVSGIFPIEKGVEAFEAAKEKKAIKILISF
ncbi:MAG: alcohol dehydrogenase catalytic domain-containing protein [Prolixibacteraceae bacterium]|nr:alcohol dehydrogenase catalytic domain-containing protein [Prolixibacteraceae bacterium]